MLAETRSEDPSMADDSSPASGAGDETPRHIGFFETLGDGIFAGLIGASAVALWFLALDTVTREPLFTPSLVGSALLRGVEATPDHVVDMSMVATYTLIHCLLFAGFGIAAAWIVDRFREPPDLPPLALVCFFSLEGGFVLATKFLVPSVAETLGHGVIIVGNVLAAIAMAIALRAWESHARTSPTGASRS